MNINNKTWLKLAIVREFIDKHIKTGETLFSTPSGWLKVTPIDGGYSVYFTKLR